MTTKPLHFGAFGYLGVSHTLEGPWRIPEAENHKINSLEHWTSVAKELEEWGFEFLFFADSIGLGAPWGKSYESLARAGRLLPVNDHSVLLSALIAVTTKLKFVYTNSIVQDPPFDFARKISTLDHFSGGRIAWNIVTSTFDNSYTNFGYDGIPGHDERYEWAQEYADVVYKLWEGSWDDDSFLADKEQSVVADASRIHRINHVGERYRVEGPHLVSPSPQRTPLLFQAGASPQGQRFGATNAEGVFLFSPNPEAAGRLTRETRGLAEELGRDASDITFFQGLQFIVGETEEEAHAKEEYLDSFIDPALAAYQTVGNGNIDAGGLPLDTPLSQVGEITGTRGFLRWAQELSGSDDPTLGDLARAGERQLRVVGTPDQIADRLEEWSEAGVDGINVLQSTRPGSWRDVGRLLFPTLRERGLLAPAREGSFRDALFSRGDQLPETHRARSYRGAFGDASLADQL